MRFSRAVEQSETAEKCIENIHANFSEQLNIYIFSVKIQFPNSMTLLKKKNRIKRISLQLKLQTFKIQCLSYFSL